MFEYSFILLEKSMSYFITNICFCLINYQLSTLLHTTWNSKLNITILSTKYEPQWSYTFFKFLLSY